MAWFIFVLLNVLNGIVLTSSGYGITTWQWWVGTICVCGAYACGCLRHS